MRLPATFRPLTARPEPPWLSTRPLRAVVSVVKMPPVDRDPTYSLDPCAAMPSGRQLGGSAMDTGEGAAAALGAAALAEDASVAASTPASVGASTPSTVKRRAR